jgi:hypothetical protein
LEVKKELFCKFDAFRGDDHNGDLVMLFGFLCATSPQEPLQNEACYHHERIGRGGHPGIIRALFRNGHSNGMLLKKCSDGCFSFFVRIEIALRCDHQRNTPAKHTHWNLLT